VVERLWARLEAPGMTEETAMAIEAVAGHELDPYAAADRLLAALEIHARVDAEERP
jgi:hypothetical protein